MGFASEMWEHARPRFVSGHGFSHAANRHLFPKNYPRGEAAPELSRPPKSMAPPRNVFVLSVPNRWKHALAIYHSF
jgi:hypothetical protein